MPDPQGTELTQLELRYQRTTKWVALWMVVATIVIAMIWRQSGYQIDLHEYFKVAGFHPRNASALTALFLFLFFVRPSAASLGLVTLAGLVLEMVYSWHFLPQASLAARLNASGGGLGVAAFLAMVAWSMGGATGVTRVRARIYAMVALTLFLYPECGGKFLGIISLFTPHVYDYCGYAVEGALGFYPSQEVAKFLIAHPDLAGLGQVIYSRLTFFVVLSLLVSQRRGRDGKLDLLSACLLSALAAVGLYQLLPMVGIDHYVGRPTWPMNPLPPLLKFAPVEAPGNFPRTCIPSIHTCWILFALLNVWSSSKRWLALFVPVTLLTLAATMSEAIGHYFIDILVACPYAVAFLALTAVGTPKSLERTRRQIVAAGFSLTLLPILAIRFAPEFLAEHGSLCWTTLLLLVPLSAGLFQHLNSKILMDDSTATGEVR